MPKEMSARRIKMAAAAVRKIEMAAMLPRKRAGTPPQYFVEVKPLKRDLARALGTTLRRVKPEMVARLTKRQRAQLWTRH